MKKITNAVLWIIGLAGTYLVGKGVITGEELGAMQNVIGMVMIGGPLSIGTVFAILQALPKQLVSAGYDKAVEKYGQAAVDNFVGKIDQVMDNQAQILDITTEAVALLKEAKESRENLLTTEE